jgi:PAS domain S-box-containing protein
VSERILEKNNVGAAGRVGDMSKPIDSDARRRWLPDRSAHQRHQGLAMTAAPTILVVEDNPTTRQMLSLALVAEGYGVVEAADAQEALATAEHSLPDLILQDLILPDMDGLELLRRLRVLPGGAELPILALSGFLSRLEEARTDTSGFTALLIKPIDSHHLIDTIRIHLPQQAGAASAHVHGRRLLLVDDDLVQLKLARIHFSQLGFDVRVASSAEPALIAARADRPDVVLSDVFMPATDGFQLCLQIRRDPDLADLPVVLLSGQYGSRADQDLARQVGASALVLRTPDFAIAEAAIVDALDKRAPVPAAQPNDQLELKHARLVIHQLERQVSRMAGLTQRCGVQAAQLSLLTGVADALTRSANIETVLRDVLAATLDAAGISKGALILRDAGGMLEARHAIGFSEPERHNLREFFGHGRLLEDIVEQGGSVAVPSPAIPASTSRDILAGANVASAQIVPLISDGRGVGVMIIGGTRTDVTGKDSVAFARAMGNQVVQSLELAKSVARLTASERRYRTLLESANDYIAVFTPEGIVREMNRQWVEFTGLPHERLVGRHIREFAPAGKEEDHARMCQAMFAGGVTRMPAVEIAAPNGPSVFIEFSSTLVEIADERLVFTIGRDVTQQRLLESQLRQAQKLEAVGQLAGGVAHDFNNVLTSILGFSELMLESLRPEDPMRHDMLEIKKAGLRAAGLTQQLLAFSRKQILQPKILNINSVVAAMESMLRRLIFEHVDMRVSLTPEGGMIKMDPTQLEQILVNLVVNAADAMPRGGKLTIETANVRLDEDDRQRRLRVQPGDYVMLAISDTGTGMDETTLQRMFEPFFTTKGVGKGTGLGLATVYGIVKQSGGDIWVYSEPGRGSTFKIYLPLVTARAPSAIEPVTGMVAIPRGTETILLVEDDEAVRLLVRISLERTGYRVLEAGHPKEAMRLANGFLAPIDLLLSDVIMPESDGPPLFDRLTTLQPGLRVLYMSGYADEAVLHQGVLVEGTPFLQKPFTSLTLARKVRDVLDGPRPSAGA